MHASAVFCGVKILHLVELDMTSDTNLMILFVRPVLQQAQDQTLIWDTKQVIFQTPPIPANVDCLFYAILTFN